MNFFMYCRPHIMILRKRFPGQYTWFQAFRLVVKSGADNGLQEARRQKREDAAKQNQDERDNTRITNDTTLTHDEILMIEGNDLSEL